MDLFEELLKQTPGPDSGYGYAIGMAQIRGIKQ